ncbi:MAG: hypothetical protein ACRD98_06675 [Nitrososphaera sp.]
MAVVQYSCLSGYGALFLFAYLYKANVPSVAFSIFTSNMQHQKSLIHSLMPHDSNKINNVVVTIGDGVTLKPLLMPRSPEAGLSIDLVLQIANEVGMVAAAHLAAAYIIDKIKNHRNNSQIAIGDRKVRSNKKDVAQAFLEEIEKLEK